MSSFMAASVLAWVCLLRSRSVGVEGAAHSHMLFSTECRSRLAPPLPAEYFGNCLRPCFMEATMELLMTSGGCGAIGLAIREMERGVLEGAEAEGWLGQVMSVLPQRPMSPSSSTTEHLTDIAHVRVCGDEELACSCKFDEYVLYVLPISSNSQADHSPALNPFERTVLTNFS